MGRRRRPPRPENLVESDALSDLDGILGTNELDRYNFATLDYTNGELVLGAKHNS